MATQALTYDVDRLVADMAAKGWLATDLARRARVSDMTVSRFLSGHTRTARTAKKLAAALGYSLRRYLVSAKVVADQVAQPDERVEAGARSAEVNSLHGQLPQGSEHSGVEVGGAHADEATAHLSDRPRELQSETAREATAEVSR